MTKKKVLQHGRQLIQQACPHLVREFGPDKLRICCSKGQLFDFLREFKLPEAVLVSHTYMPSCLKLF
jgi:hypothetical protein